MVVVGVGVSFNGQPARIILRAGKSQKDNTDNAENTAIMPKTDTTKTAETVGITETIYRGRQLKKMELLGLVEQFFKCLKFLLKRAF